MQWLLQKFEDTNKLADALDQFKIAYTWHKVIPFVGDLIPEPNIDDPNDVVMFGSYTLWKYSQKHNYSPGVFKITPFVHEEVWHPFLLNGKDALFLSLRDIPTKLKNDGTHWFLRPVDDSKEEPGNVKPTQAIHALANKVLALDEAEIPDGSLRHDTQLMLTKPVQIHKEWRLWIVNGQVVTFSLYRQGSKVIYIHEIDEDALEFGQKLADLNPEYSPAYVLDICKTDEGLKMLETNCINAAGFYAADLLKLADAIENMNV